MGTLRSFRDKFRTIRNGLLRRHPIADAAVAAVTAIRPAAAQGDRNATREAGNGARDWIGGWRNNDVDKLTRHARTLNVSPEKLAEMVEMATLHDARIRYLTGRWPVPDADEAFTRLMRDAADTAAVINAMGLRTQVAFLIREYGPTYTDLALRNYAG
ncbi:hypothetical protein KBX50_08310 [Micromonospora sp. C51]|uniref:hypothetical protein n=1 Tax=Micromonospora sp. C51 TaxID=2824879 RepID=UPI001B38D6D4|nr:hypothetical protein [Micromonospora sp. C51]MBQ1048467.1 hypothetical protein [Micromonospora sp. C51]